MYVIKCVGQCIAVTALSWRISSSSKDGSYEFGDMHAVCVCIWMQVYITCVRVSSWQLFLLLLIMLTKDHLSTQLYCRYDQQNNVNSSVAISDLAGIYTLWQFFLPVRRHSFAGGGDSSGSQQAKNSTQGDLSCCSLSDVTPSLFTSPPLSCRRYIHMHPWP